MSKTFSVADVAAHKDAENGMYIIVDENVYDVTGMPPFPFSKTPIPISFPPPEKHHPPQENPNPHRNIKYKANDGDWMKIGFIDEHPGGSKILKRVAGKDATKQFWKYHNESVLKKYQERLKVGTVGEKAKL